MNSSFRRGALFGALVALPAGLFAAVTLPHSFSNGELADADAVNENFAVLAAAVPANAARTDVANQFGLLNTFNGGISLGNTAVATCDDATAGRLRWTGSLLQACVGNGGGWVTLASALGMAPTTPAASCAALYASGQRASAMYYVDPNGPPATDTLYTYCDMTTDGGGWTLVYSNQFDGNEGGPTSALLSSSYGTPGLANDFSSNPMTLFAQLGATKMLVREDTNWIRFNNMTATNFAQLWTGSPLQSWNVTSMNGTTYAVSNTFHGTASGVNQFGQSAVNSTVIFEFNMFTGTRDMNHYWHIWPAANGTYAVNESVGGARRGSIWLK